MKTFKVYTLVDITETQQYRKDPAKEQSWQQQQNFSMMLQTIGMRANPLQIRSPQSEELNLDDFNFGSHYSGTQRVWSFEFDIEYAEAFTDKTGDNTGLLLDDLHFVPVIAGLEETVEFKLPVFDTRSTENRNVLVYAE
jgi:hypothetical protein